MDSNNNIMQHHANNVDPVFMSTHYSYTNNNNNKKNKNLYSYSKYTNINYNSLYIHVTR